jgi:membrane protein DedA with SNARE-associated domain
MKNYFKSIVICLLFVAIGLTTYSQTTTPTTNTEEKNIIEQVTSWYMDNMNYGTVTLLMTIESSFIPFPSEVVVPPAAYKALEENSNMNIVLVVVFATLGAIIGAVINYYLAFWLGRPIIYKFVETRFGKMCLLSKEKVEKAEQYFDKHGKSSTFIGRLVPGIRQLISIPAGLAKMNIISFISFTALGAFIWNILLAVLGYIGHGNKELIDQYSHELSYILLGLGVLFVIYLIYKGVSKKKPSKQ